MSNSCLPDLNAQRVEALSKEKDTLIMRLGLLEEERMRLVTKHFNGDVSLQKLGVLTGDFTFMEIRSKLLSPSAEYRGTGPVNRTLTGHLNYISDPAGF